MKLSPPASSSDLEAAREIAQRLHQRRRRADVPESPAPPAPAPRQAPVAPPAPASHAAPEPPSWDEPAGESTRPGEPGDPLAGFAEPDSEAELDAATDAGLPLPDVDAEEPAPEEMVGSAQPESLGAMPEPEPYGAVSSPFDLELDDTETPAEDGFGAPPSWDDIVENCLRLAQASGAMLVDPSGQVFAARGDWPAPGPDAIAAKLVATMERTLRDAPTRSISAPLMGKHLTAWRVPLTEGLVTAAFLGAAPVRAEARPSIDAEIHRGAGA
jgi:hypothetical protein